MRNKLAIIICRNIDPSLRHVLSMFMVETNPLVFVGRLTKRTREKLWEELNTYHFKYELTLIIEDRTKENGFEIKQNYKAAEINTLDIEGIILGQRRSYKPDNWEAVLGKTIPQRYTLVKHLIDSTAASAAIWDNMLSGKQKRLLATIMDCDEAIVKKIIMLSAGLHDIGKANPYWQSHTLKLKKDDEQFSSNDLEFKECNDKSLLWKHDITGGLFFDFQSNISDFSLKSFIKSIVAGHHGHYQHNQIGTLIRENEIYSPEHYQQVFSAGWVEAQKEIENFITSFITIEEEKLSSVKYPKEAEVIISGVIILADWIASQSSHIQYMITKNYIGNYNRHFEIAYDEITRFLKEEGIEPPQWKQNLKWENIYDFAPNSLQKTIVDNQSIFENPGLFLLSAPMGMGKTETSLYVAALLGENLKTSGIWIALPTQATTNAIFERSIQIAPKIYETPQNSVALLHSNSLIAEALTNIPKSKKIAANKIAEIDSAQIDDSESETLTENNVFLSSYLKEKRLGGVSAIVSSTIDQMINASLPLKHNTLRWLVLTGKTIILDEIHDFDEYTFGLIKKLVEWAGLYQIPIIAMSATLSAESQKQLVEAYVKNSPGSSPERVQNSLTTLGEKGLESPEWLYVSVTPELTIDMKKKIDFSEETPSYSSIISSPESLIEGISEIIEEEISKNPTVLVVCNTIAQAVLTYRELKRKHPDEEIILLHSRMTEPQKESRIKRILTLTGKKSQNRKKHILVSTQIVQQSMDIDYDILITQLCPLPELLQRIGRIHRHNNTFRNSYYLNNPKVYILAEKSYAKHENIINVPAALPYEPIDIISTLETLEEIGLNENNVTLWKTKDNIHEFFNIHEKLKKQPTFVEKYKELILKKNNDEKFKRFKEESLSIKSPNHVGNTGTIVDFNITESYTSKSKFAPTTRLIDPTLTICLVEKNNDNWEIVHIDKLETSKYRSMIDSKDKIGLIKKISNELISFPQYNMKLIEPYIVDIGLRETFLENIIFINYAEILKNSDFTINIKEEGLVKLDYSNSKLWF